MEVHGPKKKKKNNNNNKVFLWSLVYRSLNTHRNSNENFEIGDVSFGRLLVFIKEENLDHLFPLSFAVKGWQTLFMEFQIALCMPKKINFWLLEMLDGSYDLT